MKRFEFRLERVAAWREEQLELEESRLHQFQGELQHLEARRTALDSEEAASARPLLTAASLTAEDLHREDRFRRYAARERSAYMLRSCCDAYEPWDPGQHACGHTVC